MQIVNGWLFANQMQNVEIVPIAIKLEDILIINNEENATTVKLKDRTIIKLTCDTLRLMDDIKMYLLKTN